MYIGWLNVFGFRFILQGNCICAHSSIKRGRDFDHKETTAFLSQGVKLSMLHALSLFAFYFPLCSLELERLAFHHKEITAFLLDKERRLGATNHEKSALSVSMLRTTR
jgi:hypothetical protein